MFHLAPPSLPLSWRLVRVCLLLATLATTGIAHAASEPATLFRICVPAVGTTVGGKVPPPIVFNRFAGNGRLMRLLPIFPLAHWL